MLPRDYRPTKLFTIDEANQCLPLVRAITADLVRLAQEVLERRQRLAMLMAGREREAGNPYSDELAQVEHEIENDSQRLHEFVQELVDLGVEPKSAVDGLVDFPSVMDGRVVYLCWRLGESEILHWHELDAGFSGRQSLHAGVL
jgi:hypothetical protein